MECPWRCGRDAVIFPCRADTLLSFNLSSKADQLLILATRWLLNDYTMFSETFAFGAFFPIQNLEWIKHAYKKVLTCLRGRILAKNFSVSQWIKVSGAGAWWCLVSASDWWFRCAKYKKLHEFKAAGWRMVLHNCCSQNTSSQGKLWLKKENPSSTQT